MAIVAAEVALDPKPTCLCRRPAAAPCRRAPRSARSGQRCAAQPGPRRPRSAVRPSWALCVCRLHKSIAKQLKYALVWGSSVKHRPQKVGKDHVLHDEDIVQLVKKI